MSPQNIILQIGLLGKLYTPNLNPPFFLMFKKSNMIKSKKTTKQIKKVIKMKLKEGGVILDIKLISHFISEITAVMIAEQKALIPVGINTKPIVINRFSILIFFCKNSYFIQKSHILSKKFYRISRRIDKKPW